MNNKNKRPTSAPPAAEEKGKKYDKPGFHIQRIKPTDSEKKKGPKI